MQSFITVGNSEGDFYGDWDYCGSKYGNNYHFSTFSYGYCFKELFGAGYGCGYGYGNGHASIDATSDTRRGREYHIKD